MSEFSLKNKEKEKLEDCQWRRRGSFLPLLIFCIALLSATLLGPIVIMKRRKELIGQGKNRRSHMSHALTPLLAMVWSQAVPEHCTHHSSSFLLSSISISTSCSWWMLTDLRCWGRKLRDILFLHVPHFSLHYFSHVTYKR